MKRIACVVVLVAAAALVWVAAPAVSEPKVVRIGDLGSKIGVFEGYVKSSPIPNPDKLREPLRRIAQVLSALIDSSLPARRSS